MISLSAARASLLCLAALQPAWAQSSDAPARILRIEARRLVLEWSDAKAKPATARVLCAGPKNHQDLADDCKLLDVLDISLSSPDLEKAKALGAAAFVSQAARDGFGGNWIVFFAPDRAPAVKPDFYGYLIGEDKAGRPAVSPVSREKAAEIRKEAPNIPGIGLGPRLKLTGYGERPRFEPR